MSARLEDAVAQHVSAIHRTASASPAGGGPEWDALLRHHGLAPLDAAERSFIAQQMCLARGAVPAEVRAAFLGLQAWGDGGARTTAAAPDGSLEVASRREGLARPDDARHVATEYVDARRALYRILSEDVATGDDEEE